MAPARPPPMIAVGRAARPELLTELAVAEAPLPELPEASLELSEEVAFFALAETEEATEEAEETAELAEETAELADSVAAASAEVMK